MFPTTKKRSSKHETSLLYTLSAQLRTITEMYGWQLLLFILQFNYIKNIQHNDLVHTERCFPVASIIESLLRLHIVKKNHYRIEEVVYNAQEKTGVKEKH